MSVYIWFYNCSYLSRCWRVLNSRTDKRSFLCDFSVCVRVCPCPQWLTAAVTGQCVAKVQGWCRCLWQPTPPTRCRSRWCRCSQDTCPSPELKCWSTCLTLQQWPFSQTLVRPPECKTTHRCRFLFHCEGMETLTSWETADAHLSNLLSSQMLCSRKSRENRLRGMQGAGTALNLWQLTSNSSGRYCRCCGNATYRGGVLLRCTNKV